MEKRRFSMKFGIARPRRLQAHDVRAFKGRHDALAFRAMGEIDQDAFDWDMAVRLAAVDRSTLDFREAQR
jgi:hypothetical protein